MIPEPELVEAVAPDLSAFTAPAPPPGRRRGRKGLWLARLEQMLDQVPRQWLNATKAWGVKPSSAGAARTAMRKAELRGEVRVVEKEVWIRVE